MPAPKLMTTLLLSLMALPAMAQQTEAPAPLTMADAVRLALTSHPSVAAAEYRVEAARQRVQAAKAFPNPELTWNGFWGSVDVGGSTRRLWFRSRSTKRGAGACRHAWPGHPCPGRRRRYAKRGRRWRTKCRRHISSCCWLANLWR
ncbi:MAG: hypothetical protein COY42_13435 [Armatimonadetes bacterium CG_4_10_14_0_8_um_filter_66_14]|nr:TolC family protein [Armatimonadota bacterium]NCQ27733.1 TolC family protein [Armatimonadota bacterium]PIU87966.1 MAG: hypothetical protein COS65_31945 [Armatimonadetes bacterium CG06_land_8_20_14_3_00_66_21]PIX48699.1 MAG: hypothetical protein COZ57_04945 [Armatimonadetes bacterium CG_4_8_14_3_um_filter_66_20]PIZ44728.1 MAG: hypothetical protein COY42_13435 [Armatimonadetes bacterium CG_4_10_14_0_8_um_filter_66_14]